MASLGRNCTVAGALVVLMGLTGCGGGGGGGGPARPTGPAAPTNLRVLAVTDTAITLAWSDESSNEDGFELQRRTTGSWASLASLAANTTTYSDSGLSAGTTYRYRVRAFNASGESEWSAEVAQTTNQQPTLATVTGRIMSPYGQPVSGATVSLGGRSAVTGTDGRFTIRDVTPTTLTLTVSAAYYRLPGGSRSVPVVAPTTDLGDIELELSTEGPPPPPF